MQHHLRHFCAQAQSWQMLQTGQLIHEKGELSELCHIWISTLMNLEYLNSRAPSVCLSSDSSSSLCIPLTARPAAVPTHLFRLQGAEQRSAALWDPLRSARSYQCGAGQWRGGGGPYSPSTCLAGTDASDVLYLLVYLFCLEIIAAVTTPRHGYLPTHKKKRKPGRPF